MKNIIKSFFRSFILLIGILGGGLFFSSFITVISDKIGVYPVLFSIIVIVITLFLYLWYSAYKEIKQAKNDLNYFKYKHHHKL